MSQEKNYPNEEQGQNPTNIPAEVQKALDELQNIGKEASNLNDNAAIAHELLTTLANSLQGRESAIEDLQKIIKKSPETDIQESQKGYRDATTNLSVPKGKHAVQMLQFSPEEHGVWAEKRFEEYIMETTETWLDTAFIQAAIGDKAMATIGETSEAARILFGENSKIIRRLQQYEELGMGEDARIAGLTAITAIASILDVLLIHAAHELKLGWYSMPFILALSGIAITYAQETYDAYTEPPIDSRKFMRKRFNELETQPEAQEIVRLAFIIKDGINKLKNIKDPEELLKATEKVQKDIAEAKKLLQQNWEKLNQRPGVRKRKKRKPLSEHAKELSKKGGHAIGSVIIKMQKLPKLSLGSQTEHETSQPQTTEQPASKNTPLPGVTNDTPTTPEPTSKKRVTPVTPLESAPEPAPAQQTQDTTNDDDLWEEGDKIDTNARLQR